MRITFRRLQYIIAWNIFGVQRKIITYGSIGADERIDLCLIFSHRFDEEDGCAEMTERSKERIILMLKKRYFGMKANVFVEPAREYVHIAIRFVSIFGKHFRITIRLI